MSQANGAHGPTSNSGKVPGSETNFWINFAELVSDRRASRTTQRISSRPSRFLYYRESGRARNLLDTFPPNFWERTGEGPFQATSAFHRIKLFSSPRQRCKGGVYIWRDARLQWIKYFHSPGKRKKEKERKKEGKRKRDSPIFLPRCLTGETIFSAGHRADLA